MVGQLRNGSDPKAAGVGIEPISPNRLNMIRGTQIQWMALFVWSSWLSPYSPSHPSMLLMDRPPYARFAAGVPTPCNGVRTGGPKLFIPHQIVPFCERLGAGTSLRQSKLPSDKTIEFSQL